MKGKTSVSRKPGLTIDDSITEVNGDILVFSGKCSESGQPVDLYVKDTQVYDKSSGSTSPSCSAGETYTASLDLSSRSGFPTGNVILKAVHSNSDNTLKTEFTKEIRRNPVVTLDTPPAIGAVNAHKYLLSGTCTDVELKSQ